MQIGDGAYIQFNEHDLNAGAAAPQGGGPHVNFLRCTVVQICNDGCRVQTEDTLVRQTLLAARGVLFVPWHKLCPECCLGETVRLHSLVASPEYNGRQGMLVGRIQETGRWIFRTPMGLEIRVKPTNIAPLLHVGKRVIVHGVEQDHPDYRREGCIVASASPGMWNVEIANSNVPHAELHTTEMTSDCLAPWPESGDTVWIDDNDSADDGLRVQILRRDSDTHTWTATRPAEEDSAPEGPPQRGEAEEQQEEQHAAVSRLSLPPAAGGAASSSLDLTSQQFTTQAENTHNNAQRARALLQANLFAPHELMLLLRHHLPQDTTFRVFPRGNVLQAWADDAFCDLAWGLRCCANCDKHSNAHQGRCGECKFTHYCDRTCQQEHWETHRQHCQAMKLAGSRSRSQYHATRKTALLVSSMLAVMATSNAKDSLAAYQPGDVSSIDEVLERVVQHTDDTPHCFFSVCHDGNLMLVPLPVRVYLDFSIQAGTPKSPEEVEEFTEACREGVTLVMPMKLHGTSHLDLPHLSTVIRSYTMVEFEARF